VSIVTDKTVGLGQLEKLIFSKISDGIVILSASLEIQYLNQRASVLLAIDETACLGERIGTLKIRKEIKEWVSQGSSAPQNYPPLSIKSDAGAIIATISLLPGAEPLLLLLLSTEEGGGQPVVTKEVKEISEREKTRREFLAILAHDLRSPLHKIMLSTEVLRDSEITREKQEHFFGVLERSSKSMLELLNDILGLIRIEAGELEMNPAQVEIELFLKDLVESQREFADRQQVTIDLKYDGIKHFWFDEKRIRQVLTNLVSNALKFAPPESTVTISVQQVNSGLRWEVRDSGPGVEVSLQKRLFRPFSKGENQPTSQLGSTGLGLAICKQIVELHGGQIGVDSDGQNGSTFWFELPDQS